MGGNDGVFRHDDKSLVLYREPAAKYFESNLANPFVQCRRLRTGIALGTLAILRVETAAGRLLVGGSVNAIVIPGVMLLLLPQLRVELLRLFSLFNARIRVSDGGLKGFRLD